MTTYLDTDDLSPQASTKLGATGLDVAGVVRTMVPIIGQGG